MLIQIVCWVCSQRNRFDFMHRTFHQLYFYEFFFIEGELCMNVSCTLRSGGSVLIPCYPSGVVYDLFECLSSSLDSHGLSQVPMFFISPVADSSLAYSNILAEWLSSVKQNKVCFYQF